MELEPGLVIAGKYRLDELLGAGGMAVVWSATNVFTERQFAIKFLLPSLAQTKDASERFLMEAKASARINHPNIIEVIDVGQAEDGSLFLVMELLTGDSLEIVISRQVPKMRLYDFCSVMLEVARALSAAHKSGVIHRDLKPTNILLHQEYTRDSRDGRMRDGRMGEALIVPKLLDFGISKFLMKGERIGSVTLTGTILGSPMYMSPEQAQGSRSVDGRTDIFAFGSILFEALVGYRCFDARHINALLIAVATKQPRSIDECAPHLPGALRDLVRGCLVVDRNQRIASFDDVIDRLEHLLPDLEHDPAPIATPLETAEMAPPEAMSPPRSSVAPLPAHDKSPTLRKARPAPRSHRAQYFVIGLCTALATIAFFIVYTGWRPGLRAAANAQIPPVTPAAPAETSPAPNGAPSAVSQGAEEALPAATEMSSSSTAPSGTFVDRSGMGTPVVNVDSLPSAERAAQHPHAPRRSERKAAGRLQVTAVDEACTLYVDDARRGTTPLSVDVPAGSHRLRCESDVSDAKTADVSVSEGATTKYTFRFE